MKKIRSCAVTNIGKIRENNEDAYFVSEELGIFAVFDGMGGEENGEVAAQIALETLKKYAKMDIFDKNIFKYIEEANKRICLEMEKHRGRRLGSTIAMLYIKENVVTAYNIGDSKIYLYRNEKLEQLSFDHTISQQMVNLGVISKEQAKSHKDKNRLTQHLGIFPEEMKLEPFISKSIDCKVSDRFLICTDGLTDMVNEERISEIMSSNQTVELLAKQLEQTALENGGRDNITIILVEII